MDRRRTCWNAVTSKSMSVFSESPVIRDDCRVVLVVGYLHWSGGIADMFTFLIEVDCLAMLSPGFATYPGIVSASIFKQIRVISAEDQSWGFGVEQSVSRVGGRNHVWTYNGGGR